MAHVQQELMCGLRLQLRGMHKLREQSFGSKPAQLGPLQQTGQ